MALPAYLTQVMLDHPIGLWALNDLAGASVVADINPTEFGPSSPGTPTSVTFGQAGGPVSGLSYGKFNGSTSTILTASTPLGGLFDFSGIQPYSVDFLINIAGAAASGHWPRLVERELYAPTRNGWSVLNNQSSTQIYSERWASGVSAVSAFYTLTIGSWYHIAVVYDGALLHLYGNGVEQGSGVASSAAIAAQSTFVGISSSIDPTFNGSMFGVAVYNYALTAAQVVNHYNAWQGAGQEYYTPFQSGFQPWDVAGFGSINAWYTENYQGGGFGAPPTLRQNAIVGLVTGNPNIKYWALPSTINPLG